MIFSRAPAPSSVATKSLSVVPESAAPYAEQRVSGPAVEAFALGISSALIAALAERGDDVSSVALRLRLQAYSAPRTTGSGKLRRYA